MKDLTITAIIKVYQYDELNEADRALMQTAMEATARSYSPYSHFSVGAAALLGNGTVVTGTNQENAAYPSGLCAERTTLFYANSQYPDQPVVTLAIAARTEKDFIDHPIPLRCLPASDSGNGKALQTTHPHPIIWQRMYLRSKKYRRSTAIII
jgi:cytidine deaminase